jgi:hypothetical protein
MDIEQVIKETMEVNYTMCYPIENFRSEELIQLAEKCRKKIEIRIEAEHSNFYQGVLVNTRKFEEVTQ